MRRRGSRTHANSDGPGRAAAARVVRGSAGSGGCSDNPKDYRVPRAGRRGRSHRLLDGRPGLRRCPRSDSRPGARVRGPARGRRHCRRTRAVPQDPPRQHDGRAHSGAPERHNDEQGQLRGQGARGDVRRPRGRRDDLRRIRGQHPDGLVHAGGGRAERHRPARRPVDRIDLPWREPDACDRGGVRERWRRACGDPGVPGAGTGRHSAERDRLRRVQADRRRDSRPRGPGPVRRGP